MEPGLSDQRGVQIEVEVQTIIGLRPIDPLS